MDIYSHFFFLCAYYIFQDPTVVRDGRDEHCRFIAFTPFKHIYQFHVTRLRYHNLFSYIQLCDVWINKSLNKTESWALNGIKTQTWMSGVVILQCSLFNTTNVYLDHINIRWIDSSYSIEFKLVFRNVFTINLASAMKSHFHEKLSILCQEL